MVEADCAIGDARARYPFPWKGDAMTGVEQAIRELEQIQMSLVRVHALLAREGMSARDRHRVDGYFDAFASDLTGLDEYLRSMNAG